MMRALLAGFLLALLSTTACTYSEPYSADDNAELVCESGRLQAEGAIDAGESCEVRTCANLCDPDEVGADVPPEYHNDFTTCCCSIWLDYCN